MGCGCRKAAAAGSGAAGQASVGSRVRVLASSMGAPNPGDTHQYPALVWEVCPDTDNPIYIAGTEQNWSIAQGLALQAGCDFSSSRAVLPGPPVKGNWLDPEMAMNA